MTEEKIDVNSVEYYTYFEDNKGNTHLKPHYLKTTPQEEIDRLNKVFGGKK